MRNMIFVFKTGIKSKKHASIISPHLDKLLPNAKWNFDLEDCDKILRVESRENIVLAVINFSKLHNFPCEELE